MRTLAAWQFLALERGPVWMLRLLARDGVEGPIIYENIGPFRSVARYDPNFFWSHAVGEKQRRGLQGVPSGFTGKKRRQMVDELMRIGIDGNDGSILTSGSHDMDEVAEVG
jgi:hypothetical protein